MPSPVTAADYLGSVPVVAVSCPDDTEKVKADDLRNAVAALLANQYGSGYVVPYQAVFTATLPPYVIGPPNLFNSGTWTNSAVMLDVLNAKVNDDLRISVWGTWQFNSSSAPGDVVWQMQISVQEDADNMTPPSPIAVPGIAVFSDNAGTLTLNADTEYSLIVRHRVTAAGKARVNVQLRYVDLTGGPGTGTAILLHSSRLDVDHSIRS